MKTKLFIFILLFNFAAATQCGAQHTRETRGDHHDTNFRYCRIVHKNSNEYTGSPYLNKEFQTGDVIKIDSRIYNDQKLRYNIYEDQIEFKNKDTIRIVPGKSFTKSVRIGEKTFIYTDYIINGKNHFGILEQLTKGNCSLYYRHKVDFEEAVKPSGYKEAKPANFMNVKGKFFIQITNKPIIDIHNKKHLLMQFPNKKKEIQKFIKTKKINIKKKADLIILVQYCNELNKASI